MSASSSVGARSVGNPFEEYEEASTSRNCPGTSLYPKAMIKLFRRCHLSIDRLPVLDFGDRMGGTGYIDMLQPADMTHPIMRFKDRFNRPGIAFHVEGHANGNFKYGDQQRQIRDISGVLVVFKRYPGRDPFRDPWTVGMGGILEEAMYQLHNDRHNQNDHVGSRVMECPTCPSGMRSGNVVNYFTLYNLLTGNDPLFRITQEYVPPENPVPTNIHVNNHVPAAVGPVQPQMAIRSCFSGRIIAVVIALAALAIAYLGLLFFYQQEDLSNQTNNQ